MPFGGRGLGGVAMRSQAARGEPVTNAFRREGVGRVARKTLKKRALHRVTNAFRREGVGRAAD